MSRLIYADRLRELYEDCEGLKVPCEVILQNIDDQPTAYDVEAVVRELEKEYEATIDLYKRTADVYFSGEAYGLDIAIAIVKRGGRNED